MKYLDKLVSSLIKRPLSLIQFEEILKNSDRFYDSIDLEKELLLANGLPLYFSNDNVYLKTTLNTIQDQVFCIVDIETTAGNPKDGQIIEIGAVKYKNGNILETYQSFVTANYIPQKVQEITGITLNMLENAPNLKDVLEEFKIFLEDDVFVAHNVNFDYNFISQSLEKYNLGKLLNRRLCTIEFSKRVFITQRYGLKYLKELLNIDLNNHHRALDDAFCTAKILQYNLENMNTNVKNIEELIRFVKN